MNLQSPLTLYLFPRGDWGVYYRRDAGFRLLYEVMVTFAALLALSESEHQAFSVNETPGMDPG
jgi:hypothetical protein